MTTSESGVISGPRLPEPVPLVSAAVLEHARRHPERTAVICGEERVSYGELAAGAAAVARAIGADERCAAARRIGVVSHRTAGAAVHALGIWLSGRSFVFLDPAAPQGAAEHIRRTAGLSVVVDPREWPAGPAGAVPAAVASRSPDAEAYVLFTSGSSGRPKGVSVSQGNLAHSNAARLALYDGFGVPVFLLLSPFHFDSSLAGLWGTLAAGGTLVVADEEERRVPQAVLGLIARHRVTHTLTVPGFHRELLHTLREDERHTAQAASLRLVTSAGEALPQSVLDRHFALLPGVALSNEYGPTECTVWSTARIYEKPGPTGIGFPIPGTSLRLLDDRLRPVPPGAVGQIAVSGPGVAQGYVGDERQTAAKFVDLPATAGPPVRAYLTGDLGRFSDEEGLEFVGRLDNEVKIRGVRVHLETLEEALTAHPGVRAAAVAYDAETAVCHAFVVAEPGAEPSAASIRGFLEGELGAAVVPDRIVFTAALPRTAHDKTDRAALLATTAPPVEPERLPGEGALADHIARVWEKVLGVPVASSEQDTFFSLGGNSLTVIRLSRALGELAGRPVGVKNVYRCGTIPQQVDLLSRL
ncbi:non-ribosomal peptide synthetase [Streptomyces sp. NPDC047072]|uniref:non-ribosomal peptide synthetase n=1 Tax=Streptomyces sp. NPDC047072 TaxID=3154809 RepID=UPI0033DF5993